MRIVIYSINYWPDLIGIAKYNAEMAEWLVQNGHDVQVVSAPPYYPNWEVKKGYSSWFYRKEKVNGVIIWRCPLYVPKKPTGMKRLLHLFSFAFSSFPIIISRLLFKPDIILVIEPPLLCAPAAWLTSRLSGAKAWLHVQDFEVDAAIEMKLLPKFLNKCALWFEKNMLSHFDRVSTISEKMQERLIQKGVEKEKAVLFPNWVDLKKIYPMGTESSLRKKLGFTQDNVVFLYSGNMSVKQGLELIIESATQLQDQSQIKFVLCGEGPAKEKLIHLSQDLTNTIFLPLQPIENLNDLLNVADVHLLPQIADAADLVMPSKLTGMLASGRPIIATADQKTQVGMIVKECGLLVEPNQVDDLVQQIQLLVQDKALRAQIGEQARNFAVNHLSLDDILHDYFG